MVPVCNVIYASSLWSVSDNNSWELFTLFWNASKQCQSFPCFRVPLCSTGSWVLDDRFSVLGVGFSSHSPAAKHQITKCRPVHFTNHRLCCQYNTYWILKPQKLCFMHNDKWLFKVALGIIYCTNMEGKSGEHIPYHAWFLHTFMPLGHRK